MKTLADLPLKPRLQLIFTAITVTAILVLSVFSLLFFYGSIRDTAVRDLRNKAEIVQTLIDTKKAAVLDYAANLAADKTFELLLDLDIGAKMSEFLLASAAKEKKYHLEVFTSAGDVYSDVGFEQSVLALGGRKRSVAEEKLFKSALEGDRLSMLATLDSATGQPVPSISAAVPITRDRRILGVLQVHYVLPDNPDFLLGIKAIVGIDVALHIQGKNAVGSPDLKIAAADYLAMTGRGQQFEKNDLIGTGLDLFRVVKDGFGSPMGILQLHQGGDEFRQTFVTALLFYLLFSLVMIAVVAVIVVRTSRRILDPIGTLLTGVHKIAEGDLRHEILLMVQDEIGQLGHAFNEMRQSLFDKIQEINDLNQSLEAKVRDRTLQIEELNSKLRHYLSPQLYASLVGGQRDASVEKHYRKKLTIFFSDVVNFTSTSDSLEPEDLSNLLNSYLDNMSKIAMTYGGTIDKYVGDAIMVFFGDPEFTSDQDHALRAVSMSMDMLAKLDELREEWTAKGVTNPFHVRIGINTGYCTVGNFGSEMKMDYTIIGNNVNLAARYEAAAEADTVLISHETYMLVRDQFEFRDMGEYTLKGVPHPVHAYRPLRKKNAEALGWVTVGDRNLYFHSRKVDLSQVTEGEREALKQQLKSAVRFLEK